MNAPYFVDLGTTPYDPAKANALLDEAGWMRGADGIRAKNGVRLDLNVATRAGTPDTDEQIELMRDDWKQIGVGLTVQHYPPALMFAPAQQGGIVYGDKWDVITFAWAADPLGDYSAIYGCNAFPPAGQNNVRWCNQTAQARDGRALRALRAVAAQRRRQGRRCASSSTTCRRSCRSCAWTCSHTTAISRTTTPTTSRRSTT